MTVVTRVREWLEREHVKYEVRPHMEAFTAQEVAGAAHIPGRAFAKVVMLKGTQGLTMAVLPAKCRVDVARLRGLLRDETVALAHEPDFEGMFPGCETGAMPAFGNLYGIPVYMDKDLIGEQMIAFPAGTHHEVIKITSGDFLRLTGARVEEFCEGE
jgi:Ala-tRNA(Pro) deacylase